MHLHGFYFAVEARGDNVVDTTFAPASRRRAVTELLRAGHTMTIAWSPDRPGGWLFHCHMTPHFTAHAPVDRHAGLGRDSGHGAGDPDSHALTGMGGLVLATTVRGPSPAPAMEPAHVRRLQLFVDSDSVAGDTVRRFGYVLQTGVAAPRPDSVPVPGSTIVLTRGEPTVIEVVNRTGEPTAVHWHGIELESYYDGVVGVGGVPGRVTPAIRPGHTFESRITPRRAGTFIYHTHYDELRQQFGGLYGAVVVLEPGERWDPDRDRVLIVSDAREGPNAMLNGSTDPPPITLRARVPYRFRWINITAQRVLPRMSLRRAGEPVTWRVLAKDGWPVPPEQAKPVPSDARVSVGETLDVMVTPEAPGELTFEARNASGRVLVRMPVWVR
jgi:FtsP/CotA-like multicopper oxidase with cupredoxin domain